MTSKETANGGVRDHLIKDFVNPVPRQTNLITKEINDITVYKTPYEDYWVTEDGQVWSERKNRNHFLKQCSAPNKQNNPKDYKKVYLYNGNGRSIVRVHRLMMETFYGKCPDGYVVDHIDNNPSNNHISNLRYLSQADNTRIADNSNHKVFHKEVKVYCGDSVETYSSVNEFKMKYGLSRRKGKPSNYIIGKPFGCDSRILKDFKIGTFLNEIWLE